MHSTINEINDGKIIEALAEHDERRGRFRCGFDQLPEFDTGSPRGSTSQLPSRHCLARAGIQRRPQKAIDLRHPGVKWKPYQRPTRHALLKCSAVKPLFGNGVGFITGAYQRRHRNRH